MGANSFFIDILLFGELMGPLSVIRYPLSDIRFPLTGFVRQGKAVRYVLIAASGLYDGMMYLQKQRAQAPLSSGLHPQSGLAQRAYCMPPKAAFKTSIARQGDTTILSGFAAVNLKNLKNPRLQRSRPPLLFQTFNHP